MPGVNNNIILTTVGLDYLKQRKQAGEKAIIERFRLGDAYRFTPSESDTAIHGTQVYEDMANEGMWWIQYSPEEVILRCRVDSDKGDFYIGNIGLYSDTGVLLFIAAMPYAHHKMKSTLHQAGGRWTFQFRLNTPNVLDLFDFSNIELRYAAMEDHILRTAPKHPFDSFYTELQLDDSFLPTNRSGYFNISGKTSRKWYTSPFQQAESYITIFEDYEISGGNTGDRHTGIW